MEISRRITGRLWRPAVVLAMAAAVLGMTLPANADTTTHGCRQGSYPYETAKVTYSYYVVGSTKYVHISNLTMIQTNPANGAPVSPMDYHIYYANLKTQHYFRPNIHNDYRNSYIQTYVSPTFPDEPISAYPGLWVDAGRPFDGVPDCRSLSIAF